MNPNYNIMLDSYVTKCKTTYEEYKQVLILLITYTSINNKGRLVYYEGSLIKKLEEQGYTQEQIHLESTGKDFRRYFNSIIDLIINLNNEEELKKRKINTYKKYTY